MLIYYLETQHQWHTNIKSSFMAVYSCYTKNNSHYNTEIITKLYTIKQTITYMYPLR